MAASGGKDGPQQEVQDEEQQDFVAVNSALRSALKRANEDNVGSGGDDDGGDKFVKKVTLNEKSETFGAGDKEFDSRHVNQINRNYTKLEWFHDFSAFLKPFRSRTVVPVFPSLKLLTKTKFASIKF